MTKRLKASLRADYQYFATFNLPTENLIPQKEEFVRYNFCQSFREKDADVDYNDKRSHTRYSSWKENIPDPEKFFHGLELGDSSRDTSNFYVLKISEIELGTGKRTFLLKPSDLLDDEKTFKEVLKQLNNILDVTQAASLKVNHLKINYFKGITRDKDGNVTGYIPLEREVSKIVTNFYNFHIVNTNKILKFESLQPGQIISIRDANPMVITNTEKSRKSPWYTYRSYSSRVVTILSKGKKLKLNPMLNFNLEKESDSDDLEELGDAPEELKDE